MAAKQGTRADFISDGSSSESDSLPEIGSLRERLARKRKLLSGITALDDVSSIDFSNTRDPKKNESVINSGCLVDGQHIVLSEEENYRQNKLSLSDSSQDSVVSVKTLNVNTSIATISESVSSTVDLTSEISETRLVTDDSIGHSLFDNDTASNCSSVSSVSVPGKPGQREKKKRTTEEIEENKRKAKEKKEEREKLRMAKEAEKQMRKVERESKKQVSLGSCLKYLTVLVDTHIVNTCGCGVLLFKACAELGVTCQTRELRVPFTIMWQRQVTECSMSADMKVETVHTEVEEREVLTVIPVTDFVLMVHTYKQKQRGLFEDGISLRDYVLKQQSQLGDKSITVVVPGLEQYFRDLKFQKKKKHKEAVRSTDPDYVSKQVRGESPLVTVSRVEIEEALTDTQLQTGCCTYMVDTHEDLADLVRRFSKAVAERPAKKDRFDPVFSFHEEGVGGVKVDKNGVGLLKVWKQQLMQFKNVSPDIAQAIISEYPSPRLLRQAYLKCSSEKEAIRILENIVVRRGAGVLETTRRIGKELSRRIYTFCTSDDPDLVIR